MNERNTKSEHTPGKWVRESLVDGIAVGPASSDGAVYNYEHPTHVAIVERLSDARLIAAAPELLAMLERAEGLASIMELAGRNKHHRAFGAEIGSDIREAIAKATGRL